MQLANNQEKNTTQRNYNVFWEMTKCTDTHLDLNRLVNVRGYIIYIYINYCMKILSSENEYNKFDNSQPQIDNQDEKKIRLKLTKGNKI